MSEQAAENPREVLSRDNKPSVRLDSKQNKKNCDKTTLFVLESRLGRKHRY